MFPQYTKCIKVFFTEDGKTILTPEVLCVKTCHMSHGLGPVTIYTVLELGLGLGLSLGL